MKTKPKTKHKFNKHYQRLNGLIRSDLSFIIHDQFDNFPRISNSYFIKRA